MTKREQVTTAARSIQAAVPSFDISRSEKVYYLAGARAMLRQLASMGLFGQQLSHDAQAILLNVQLENKQ